MLDGRSALVTGASRGIGRACARALHAAGARLTLLSRDLAALRAFASELGDGVTCHAADLGAARLDDEIQKVQAGPDGAPDIIVCNAASFLVSPVDDTDVADFARVVAVNLTGHFALIQALLPAMRRQGRGHIVTIGSLADHQALPGNAAYAASKFGLRALTGVLREELRGSGVRVTLVSPEHVDTDIWKDATPRQRAELAPRMLDPDAVADAVRFAVTAPPAVNVDELRLSRA